MVVLYTGLREETLDWIKNHLPAAPIFTAIQLEPSTEQLAQAGLVIVGENIPNPIKVAQEVFSQDRNVSILIINDDAAHQKIKQAMQFTPFLGNTIQCISNQGKQGLGPVVENQLLRTEQRRNYLKIKSTALPFASPAAHLYERVKQQYIDKVLEHAPIGIILLNEEGMIQAINPYAAQLFNKAERAVLGTYLTRLFPDQWQEEVTQLIKQSTAGSHKGTFEYIRDQAQRYLEITLSALSSREALPYKTVLLTDITEQVIFRKEAEARAREVKQVLESLPQIAWTADTAGNNTYLNQRWYEYTQQPPPLNREQAEVSFGLRDYLHPNDVEAALSHWSDCVSRGEPSEIEYRLRRGKDGMYRWMLSRALPLRDAQGEINQWVGTATDIHDLKMAEQDLQTLNEELSAANEEIQANNEELSVANGQLTQVNADMDNFIYTASHDLKAPITNIEGLMQALVRYLPPESLQTERVKKIVEHIQDSVGRFKKTIEDLTHITRLQRDASLDLEMIRLSDILADVQLDMHTEIQETEARIEVDLEECAPIHFSRKNLRSIVYNLFSNALKYRSPERIPVIRLSCRENEEYTVFSVSDNGLGMDLSGGTKIFSMFKRLHDHVEGSGIGLYIIKKIVDNAGGKIEVESKVGQGTTFEVYFKRLQYKVNNSQL